MPLLTQVEPSADKVPGTVSLSPVSSTEVRRPFVALTVTGMPGITPTVLSIRGVSPKPVTVTSGRRRSSNGAIDDTSLLYLGVAVDVHPASNVPAIARMVNVAAGLVPRVFRVERVRMPPE